MKAVIIALVLLIFNVTLSAVIGSGLFTAHDFYESEFSEKYAQISDMTNMTKTDIEPPTMDIFNMFTSTLTFDWVKPMGKKIGIGNEIAAFVALLNTILAAIVGIAFIELFLQRSDILGGNG